MPAPVNQQVPNTNQQLPQETIPVAEAPAAVLPRRKIALSLGVVVLFILLGAIAGYYFLIPKNQSVKETAKSIISQIKTGPKEPEATPTPMPFADMTIPYLRERSYKSELAKPEPVYDGTNYSAYTTSYTSDGYKVNGLLTIPFGQEAPGDGWPAIVFVHGYIPPGNYQTLGQAYSTYVDYLASNGFVVFKIDLRGHGKSEGDPGGAYYSSDYIVDVLNAYSALEHANFVNPKKIGLWGHSMAGNVTMRSWAVKKDIPAVVIWAGAVYTYEDMVKYRITDSSFQPQANNTQRLRKRQQIYEEYGSPSAKVKFWQETAPVTYLNELKGAIQIHHAIDDDVVNIAYSRDLNALLEKTKLHHEFYEYVSGGHNISGASYNEAMQRTVDFYKKYLE